MLVDNTKVSFRGGYYSSTEDMLARLYGNYLAKQEIQNLQAINLDYIGINNGSKVLKKVQAALEEQNKNNLNKAIICYADKAHHYIIKNADDINPIALRDKLTEENFYLWQPVIDVDPSLDTQFLKFHLEHRYAKYKDLEKGPGYNLHIRDEVVNKELRSEEPRFLQIQRQRNPNKVKEVEMQMAAFASLDQCLGMHTHGLGPCIGLAIYDKDNKEGFLAHYLNHNLITEADGKFLDADGLEEALDILQAQGKLKGKPRAHLFGGSYKNYLALKEILKRKNIEIVETHIGNNPQRGQSVYLNLQTGEVINYGKASGSNAA